MPRVRAGDLERMCSALVRNFPMVLLLSAGYFVFFSALWGATVSWKLSIATVIVVGASLALGDGRLARSGSRRLADEAMRWPTWRRVAAIVSGLLITFAGVYATFVRDVDPLYPLLRGLCLIVSTGLGTIFVVYGWPRTLWEPPSRPPRRARPIAPPQRHKAPERQLRSGGTTIRVPVPKDMGYSGGFGGVGSKPADRAWTPGAARTSDGVPELVPHRFRRLRLVRRYRSHAAPSSALILVVLLAVGFAVILVTTVFLR